MATILHIKASIRGDRSYSNQTAAAFLDSYSEAHPGDTVRTVDLAAAGLPEFDAEAVKFNWERIKAANKNPAVWMKDVKDIKILDKYTVRFDTTKN